MSVLIKGMDIPKSCSDCPLNYDEMSCAVTGTRWLSDTMVLLNFDYTKERLHDCPLSEVPSAQPETKPIGYRDCANAMLKMWMDNVVTDGEYNRIMDKLNAHWAESR